MYGNDQGYGIELKNVAATFGRLYEVDISRPRGRNEYRFNEKAD